MSDIAKPSAEDQILNARNVCDDFTIILQHLRSQGIRDEVAVAVASQLCVASSIRLSGLMLARVHDINGTMISSDLDHMQEALQTMARTVEPNFVADALNNIASELHARNER